jgi:glycosyltransferase involved in cell wall biosynthesis
MLNIVRRFKARRIRGVDDLTILIPTWNSGEYIDIFLSYYMDILKVPVVVVIDSKTDDNTRWVAKRWAADVWTVHNPANRVGEIIETFSRAAPTRWILRMDDDELPSLALFDFVRRAIVGDDDAYSFLRYECGVAKDGTLLRHFGFDPVEQQQYRLYRRDRVQYITDGHTPGFEINGLRSRLAGEDCLMIHLDWAVHSRERRRTKKERYDAHTPGHGDWIAGLILYEDDPDHQAKFTPLELPEFQETARRLAKRFPALCIR